jgi:aminocarboxymuconate-semialdehyde decarboxylase
MYFDSITHSDRSLRYLIDTVGSSQVLLGSDYPADMGEPYPVDFVNNCKTITDDEKKLILSENIKAFI